ncbi:MAG: amidohydrolase [Pusillimonas sp.]
MIIDSHAHVSNRWYEPVESLLAQMVRNGVDAAVLVQLLGHYDNQYLIDCVRRYPGQFACVALVDCRADDVHDVLDSLAAQGVRGIRLRPTDQSPGTDPLAIWKQAAELGLVVSCVGNEKTFLSPEFASVLDAVPAVQVVLEHLGGTSSAPQTDEELAQRRLVFGLARYTNVFMKVPGLGEIVPRKTLDMPVAQAVPVPQAPLLTEALAQFGASRLMWGSDFPVVSSREGYTFARQWVAAALSDKIDAAGINLLFGGTAKRLFFDSP